MLSFTQRSFLRTVPLGHSQPGLHSEGLHVSAPEATASQDLGHEHVTLIQPITGTAGKINDQISRSQKHGR